MSYEVRNEEDSIAVYVDGKEVGRYAVVEDAERETEEFRGMLGAVARSVRGDLFGNLVVASAALASDGGPTNAQLRRLIR